MPSRAIAGTDLCCHEVVKALGLDPNGLIRVELTIDAQEVVICTTSRQVYAEEIERMATVLRTYRLHLVESEDSPVEDWESEGGRPAPEAAP